MKTNKKSLMAVILCVALSAGITHAAPILITFDDIPGMSNAPGSAVPLASRLGDQYLGLTGALFSSASPFVAVVDLTSSGPNHAISNPNGIGGVNAAGNLSYGTPIDISFFEVGSGLAGVTDFVSIRGDQIPIAGTATLTAFGLDNSLLGSFTANDASGGLSLTLALAGIHRVSISETSATIAFDNLMFNAAVAPATVIEPASLLLFGAGVLVILGLRRARRSI